MTENETRTSPHLNRVLGLWKCACHDNGCPVRHPDQARIRLVTVNVAPFKDFDPDKEWVILPGSLSGIQEVVAEY
jgi:hypothetical protein